MYYSVYPLGCYDYQRTFSAKKEITSDWYPPVSSTGLERLCSDNGEIVSVISEMEDISIGARRYGHSIGRGLTIEKEICGKFFTWALVLWPSGVFEVWEKMIRKVKTLEGVDFDVKAMSCQCLWYKGGGSDWNYEGRKDVDRRHKVIADIRTPPTAVTNLPLNSKRLYAFKQIYASTI